MKTFTNYAKMFFNNLKNDFHKALWMCFAVFSFLSLEDFIPAEHYIANTQTEFIVYLYIFFLCVFLFSIATINTLIFALKTPEDEDTETNEDLGISF